MGQQSSAIKIFFCYAHEDKKLLDVLKKHLSPLQRQNLIDVWHDRDISAGTEWKQEIEKHLNEAQIILLLISPAFIASEYCCSTEMQHALKRHRQREAKVIPVILRPVDDWKKIPSEGIQLGQLQALPTDTRAVTSWWSRDQAWKAVVEGIRGTVSELLMGEPVPHVKEGNDVETGRLSQQESPSENDPSQESHYQKTKEQWLREGETLEDLNRYEEALSAFEEALRLDVDYARAWFSKGIALWNLNRPEAALSAFEEALRLDVDYAQAWFNKGIALWRLSRQEEAFSAWEQSLRLDPYFAHAWHVKGVALDQLYKYEEALSALEQSLDLDPNSASAWSDKSAVLHNLRRYKEAHQAKERAYQLGYQGRVGKDC